MSRPVERWLETFMCKQYADTFEAFGYKTLQSVCQLNIGHLQSMGVRPDHCEKIMENVSVLRQSYMAKNAGVPPNFPSTVDPVMSPASSALANMSRGTAQSGGGGGGGGYDGMGPNYNVTSNEGQMSAMNYPQQSNAQMGNMSPGMQAYQRAAGLQYYRQGQNPAQMYPQQMQQFASQSNPYLQQPHLHPSGEGPMSQAASRHDNQGQGHMQAPHHPGGPSQGSMQHAHHGCQGQCQGQCAMSHHPHHTQGPIQHPSHLPSQNQAPMHPANQPANQAQRSMHPGNTGSQGQRGLHPAASQGQAAAMQHPTHPGSQGQGSMQPPNQGYGSHPSYGSPPVSSYSQSPSPSMSPWGGSGEVFAGQMPAGQMPTGQMPAVSMSNAGSSLMQQSLMLNGPQTPQQVADSILHMASHHYPCNGPPVMGPSVNKYRAAMGPSQMPASPMSPSPHMAVQNSPNRFPMPQQQGNHFAYPSSSPVNRTSPISPIQVRSPASVHSNHSLPTTSPGPMRSPTPVVDRSPAPSSVSSPGLGGMRSPSQSLQPLRSPSQAMSSPLHSMQQQTSPMSAAPIMSPNHAAHFSPNSIPVNSPHTSPSTYQQSHSSPSTFQPCSQQSHSSPSTFQPCSQQSHASPSTFQPCTQQSHSRQTSSPLYLDSMSSSYSGTTSASPTCRGVPSVNPLQSLQKLVMLPESQVIDPKSVVNDACLPGASGGDNSKFDDVPKNCERPDGSGKSDAIGSSSSQRQCVDGKHCGSDQELETEPSRLPAVGHGKHCGSDRELETEPSRLPAVGPVLNKRGQIKRNRFHPKSGSDKPDTEHRMAASKPRPDTEHSIAASKPRYYALKEPAIADSANYLNELKSELCVSALPVTTKITSHLSKSFSARAKSNDKNKILKKNKKAILDMPETTCCPKSEPNNADVLVTSADRTRNIPSTSAQCSMKSESTVGNPERRSESVKCDNGTDQDCKDISLSSKPSRVKTDPECKDISLSSKPHVVKAVSRNTNKSASHISPTKDGPLSKTIISNRCNTILAETKCQAISPENSVIKDSSQNTDTTNKAMGCPKEQFQNTVKQPAQKCSVEIYEDKSNLKSFSTIGKKTGQENCGSINCSQKDSCGENFKEEISERGDIGVKCPSDVSQSEIALSVLSEKSIDINSDIVDKSAEAAEDNKDPKSSCKAEAHTEISNLDLHDLNLSTSDKTNSEQLNEVDPCLEQKCLNETKPANVKPELNLSETLSGSRVVENIISLETETNPIHGPREKDTKNSPVELCKVRKNTGDLIKTKNSPTELCDVRKNTGDLIETKNSPTELCDVRKKNTGDLIETKNSPAELCDMRKNTGHLIVSCDTKESTSSCDTKESTSSLNKDATVFTSLERQSPHSSETVAEVVQTKSVSNDLLVKSPDTTVVCDRKKKKVPTATLR